VVLLGRGETRPFALLSPDALSPLPTASPCVVSCVRAHQLMIPDDMIIPLPGAVPRGRAYLKIGSS
jgi:hypothetical protein